MGTYRLFPWRNIGQQWMSLVFRRQNQLHIVHLAKPSPRITKHIRLDDLKPLYFSINKLHLFFKPPPILN